ncbi:MAG: hypothetical protein DRP25_01630, partial [Thermotoga sp.]
MIKYCFEGLLEFHIAFLIFQCIKPLPPLEILQLEFFGIPTSVENRQDYLAGVLNGTTIEKCFFK